MKKYYFFAALATVGLFASCSSDEDFSDAADARQAISAVDDNAKAPIEFGVANLTRGTGTVGSTQTGAANSWQGQKFNVFMFNKGTFDLANEGGVDIFNDSVITTIAGSNQAAYLDAAGNKQYFYYPTTGTFDFFAYRLDDAVKGTIAGVGDDNATEVTIPFTINGTQDVLIGVTDTATAINKLAARQDVITKAGNQVPAMTPRAYATTQVYSAYAARREVNPKFKFSHVLTRLYFNVIADSRAVSDQATRETTDPAEIKGFKVTSIEVRSKSKGELVAAYKSTSANANDYKTAANRISWPAANNEDWADTTKLAKFMLMSRQKNVAEKAQWFLYERNKTIPSFTIPATHEFVSGQGAKAVAGAGNTVTVTDATEVYTANEFEEDGTPKEAKKTTIGAAKLDGSITMVYFAFPREGDHGDANNTPWSEPTYDNTDNSNVNLVPLKPVTPKWVGYTAGTAAADAIYTTTDLYTVTGAETAAANDAAVTAAVEKAALGTYYYNVNNGEKYVKAEVTTGATTPGTTTDAVYTLTEYVAAETVADATALANSAKALTATGDRVYYQTDATKFVKVNVTSIAVAAVAEVPGNAVLTPVGEAIFAAPADENGYRIEIRYMYSKKDNATTVTNKEGKAVIIAKRTVDNGGVQQATNFAAGKGYAINIKLYKNGEISFDAEADNATLEVVDDDSEQGTGDYSTNVDTDGDGTPDTNVNIYDAE